ncbi:MAG: hypothetical protein ACXV3A_03290 [Kineosporiaceae bacterium]
MAAPPGPRMSPELTLPDRQALHDLETFLGRARRVDPDGACRLVVTGGVLAVYVSPVHGGGGPTVLGLRVLALAPAAQPGCESEPEPVPEPAGLDVTVALSALLDRFARVPPSSDPPVPLSLPPAAVTAAWAGVAPPRSGWDALGLLDAARLRATAAAGVREIADGVPSGAGAAAVARLRGQVWGRALAEEPADVPADVPAGVAFAAEALGFLDDAEPVALYRLRPWVRATTRRGHVLARRPALV